MFDLDDLSQEDRIAHVLKAIDAAGSSRTASTSIPFDAHLLTSVFPIQHPKIDTTGRLTRHEAHAHELALTHLQEQVLVDWTCEQARRGVPLTADTLRDCASDISGQPVSRSWVTRFKMRHPELKVKWTTGLEKCRAQALNPAIVSRFYNLLEEIIQHHLLEPENIWNMDENGIQLGVGRKLAAFVDRDQKTVDSVDDGNRELATVIEAVTATAEMHFIRQLFFKAANGIGNGVGIIHVTPGMSFQNDWLSLVISNSANTGCNGRIVLSG